MAAFLPLSRTLGPDVMSSSMPSLKESETGNRGSSPRGSGSAPGGGGSSPRSTARQWCGHTLPASVAAAASRLRNRLDSTQLENLSKLAPPPVARQASQTLVDKLVDATVARTPAAFKPRAHSKGGGDGDRAAGVARAEAAARGTRSSPSLTAGKTAAAPSRRTQPQRMSTAPSPSAAREKEKQPLQRAQSYRALPEAAARKRGAPEETGQRGAPEETLLDCVEPPASSAGCEDDTASSEEEQHEVGTAAPTGASDSRTVGEAVADAALPTELEAQEASLREQLKEAEKALKGAADNSSSVSMTSVDALRERAKKQQRALAQARAREASLQQQLAQQLTERQRIKHVKETMVQELDKRKVLHEEALAACTEQHLAELKAAQAREKALRSELREVKRERKESADFQAELRAQRKASGLYSPTASPRRRLTAAGLVLGQLSSPPSPRARDSPRIGPSLQSVEAEVAPEQSGEKWPRSVEELPASAAGACAGSASKGQPMTKRQQAASVARLSQPRSRSKSGSSTAPSRRPSSHGRASLTGASVKLCRSSSSNLEPSPQDEKGPHGARAPPLSLSRQRLGSGAGPTTKEETQGVRSVARSRECSPRAVEPEGPVEMAPPVSPRTGGGSGPLPAELLAAASTTAASATFTEVEQDAAEQQPLSARLRHAPPCLPLALRRGLAETAAAREEDPEPTWEEGMFSFAADPDEQELEEDIPRMPAALAPSPAQEAPGSSRQDEAASSQHPEPAALSPRLPELVAAAAAEVAAAEGARSESRYRLLAESRASNEAAAARAEEHQAALLLSRGREEALMEQLRREQEELCERQRERWNLIKLRERQACAGARPGFP
eukprot:TRINITY_DN61327_c0_g1_i1.p1 TRINITY_DN61327_c0_g1~~TRINITY_DN61327_c0_g1_i1.p1  ORF type:complete len:846 (-),score=181.40 TRINITY_DN61327_c0_g1_i1:71-2608(-)